MNREERQAERDKIKRKKRRELEELIKRLDLSVIFCTKCNIIHKRAGRKNALNETYITHFKFRSHDRELEHSELFKLDFKQKWALLAEKQKKEEL